MYKKALGEGSDRAWEDYKVAKKEAKRVVREAKWVRCGKQLCNTQRKKHRKSGTTVDK